MESEADYFQMRMAALERLFGELTEDLVAARPDDHEAFLLNALTLRRDKSIIAGAAASRPSAAALRHSIQTLYSTLGEMHAALGATLSDDTERQTSRQDYLLTLSDLIGPPPPRSWRDE